ncbi:MAG: hypothetical protein U0835_14935 [Isosphaeraceae bacterium]
MRLWTDRLAGPAALLGVSALFGSFLAADSKAGGPAAPGPKLSATAPTYGADVAPILERHCRKCHRPGHVAPFSLGTYEQARKRASDIADVTGERSMPPWKPEPGVGPKLLHARAMPAADVAVLKRWAEAGAPEGKSATASASAPASQEGWTLGTPDLVLETAEDYQVPASGRDIYRCFVIPTKLRDDVYVAAVEYRPGNRRVVHHMQAYIDVEGGGRDRDAADPGPGYTSFSGPGVEIVGDMGGWTPGNTVVQLPQGVGRLVPARSEIILQVHYHPSGKPEVDRTRIGLYFCKTPVKRTLHWGHASNEEFRLAAGKSDAEVKASWFVPVNLEALAVTPHMHSLGRDFRVSVTYPDGRKSDLLYIPEWDPSWQDTYYFERPVALPKGSTVRIVAHFDNSVHARNPNFPPKLVKWGQQATDEMCVGYIGVVKKDQDLTRPGEKDDLFDILLKQQVRSQTRAEALRRKR